MKMVGTDVNVRQQKTNGYVDPNYSTELLQKKTSNLSALVIRKLCLAQLI